MDKEDKKNQSGTACRENSSELRNDLAMAAAEVPEHTDKVLDRTKRDLDKVFKPDK